MQINPQHKIGQLVRYKFGRIENVGIIQAICVTENAERQHVFSYLISKKFIPEWTILEVLVNCQDKRHGKITRETKNVEDFDDYHDFGDPLC